MIVFLLGQSRRLLCKIEDQPAAFGAEEREKEGARGTASAFQRDHVHRGVQPLLAGAQHDSADRRGVGVVAADGSTTWSSLAISALVGSSPHQPALPHHTITQACMASAP